jgi:hypothetical protein
MRHEPSALLLKFRSGPIWHLERRLRKSLRRPFESAGLALRIMKAAILIE